MFCAKHHPELVSKVITVDNLRVQVVRDHKLKILSFRSKDPNFKTDPGVLPTPRQGKANGIDIVNTKFQHTDMSDRGPDAVKETIQAALDHFLSNSASSELPPADTNKLIVTSLGQPPYP